MHQAVDMRWGVRDEATDDHMTTELCMKEIDNCQRLSNGPNFCVRKSVLIELHCNCRKTDNYNSRIFAFF
jgi:hypothetical protein